MAVFDYLCVSLDETDLCENAVNDCSVEEPRKSLGEKVASITQSVKLIVKD